MNEYLKRRFEVGYPQIIQLSDNYTNLGPIILMIHEFMSAIKEEGIEAYHYVEKIEDDLFNRGLLPFKVESLLDDRKINALPPSDIKEALRYILLAFRYKEELK